MTTRVAASRWIEGPPVASLVAFCTTDAALCIFCMVPSWLIRSRATPAENLLAAAGKPSTIVCTWPRSV